MVSLNPLNGTRTVGLSQAIEITFNEPIKVGSGNIEVRLGSLPTSPLVETVNANSPYVTIIGQTLRFSVGHAWDPSADYFVRLPAGSVQDIAGNAFQGLDLHFQTTGYSPRRFYSTAGDDVFIGPATLETVVYNAFRSDVTLERITGANNWSIRGEGNDLLQGIERLQFTEKRIALDIGPSQNAGKALLFWHVFNPERINEPSWMGQVIGMFDAGHTMRTVAQWALNTLEVQEGPLSNRELVQRVYRNLVGNTPDIATTNNFLSLMEGARANYSPAKFLAEAAQLDINIEQVGLKEWQQTGVEYL